MKTILLPFRGDDNAHAPLELACTVAGRFGSYVEGLFVRQPPPLVSGEGITIPGDYITELEEEARQASERARERFAKLMADKGIPMGDVRSAADGPSAGWQDAEGFESRVVGEHGRLFDLIVVGCSSRPSAGENDAVWEAALFDSGRPVLLAPSEPPKTLGQTVLVAWNGSTETARTIGLGMQFLLGADRVVVLTVEGAPSRVRGRTRWPITWCATASRPRPEPRRWRAAPAARRSSMNAAGSAPTSCSRAHSPTAACGR